VFHHRINSVIPFVFLLLALIGVVVFDGDRSST